MPGDTNFMNKMESRQHRGGTASKLKDIGNLDNDLANRLKIQETEAKIIKAKKEITELEKTKNEVKLEIRNLNVKIYEIESGIEERQYFLDTFNPTKRNYDSHLEYNKLNNNSEYNKLNNS